MGYYCLLRAIIIEKSCYTAQVAYCSIIYECINTTNKNNVVSQPGSHKRGMSEIEILAWYWEEITLHHSSEGSLVREEKRERQKYTVPDCRTENHITVVLFVFANINHLNDTIEPCCLSYAEFGLRSKHHFLWNIIYYVGFWTSYVFSRRTAKLRSSLSTLFRNW